jgi:hypothetical protein
MWFDSSSIASLAKNALKEGKNLENDKFIAWRYFINVSSSLLAQKVVDNVLDIKDDDLVERGVADETKMVKSKTLPLLQEAGEKDDSMWGSNRSFDGSFFDSKPAPSSPITNPPPRKSDTSSGWF